MNKILIQPVVSYWANLFFFVSNLSGWHYSTRKQYNSYWISKTGELTVAEREALLSLSNLFKKYPFGSKYWGLVFLKEDNKNVWKKAKNFFIPEDYLKFRELVGIFEKRFKSLWRDDSIFLSKWAGKLLEVEERICPMGLISDLDLLFGRSYAGKTISIRVVLLISYPNKFPNGGGNLGRRSISLEISRTPFEYLRPVVLVMWHEFLHILWGMGEFRVLLRRFLENVKGDEPFRDFFGRSVREVLNEVVISSIFPCGYLANKYFNFPQMEYFASILRKNYNEEENWRDFLAYVLSPLVKEYLEERKAIDEEFLRIVYKLLWL